MTNGNVDENLPSSAIGSNKDVPEKLLPELTQTSNEAATIPEKQLEENADVNDEQHEHRGITVNVKAEKEESTPELDTTNEEDMSRKRKRKARPKKVMSFVGFTLAPTKLGKRELFYQLGKFRELKASLAKLYQKIKKIFHITNVKINVLH